MDARLQAQPTALELFTPKLVTVFREGYGLADLRADALAGLTVAIVALPLSMAIAIASGVGPERGLYTAIVGGFLVSLLGGSRVQIGGPAGAFIVLVAATVQRHGYDGLVLATLMAGAIMVLVGLFRLGAYIKYIPYPVTAGFTAGIATIILASQLKDLFGLDLAHEPAEFIPKLGSALGRRRNGAAVGRRHLARRADPDRGAAARAPALAGLPDRDRAGGRRCRRARASTSRPSARASAAFPSSLPSPSLPVFSFEKAHAVLPDALAIALLGSIESLLSAVVADGLTGRRHRSNCELVAQGVANAGSAMFGGICVTGTIARTATNIRAGARGPLAGIFHALYLLAVHGGRGAARLLRAARGARRGARGRRLEHGREGRVRRAAPVLARRRVRAARDVPAHGVRGSDDRDRGRRRDRLVPVPAPDGGDRSRSKAARSRPKTWRTTATMAPCPAAA